MRILAPIGPIEYFFVQSGTRIHKTVHYFLMEPTGGDLSSHDHEFDDVRWIGLREAEALMSFPHRARHHARALPWRAGGRHAGPRSAPARTRHEPIAPPRTALFQTHRALGARLIDFAGWEMPVQYAGIIEEHRAVRSAPGSSTCRTWASSGSAGPEAAAGLAYALVSDPPRLAPGPRALLDDRRAGRRDHRRPDRVSRSSRSASW